MIHFLPFVLIKCNILLARESAFYNFHNVQNIAQKLKIVIIFLAGILLE